MDYRIKLLVLTEKGKPFERMGRKADDLKELRVMNEELGIKYILKTLHSSSFAFNSHGGRVAEVEYSTRLSDFLYFNSFPAEAFFHPGTFEV